jgi:protein-disulfide isomerase-like protein with CxxC motif
METVDFWYDPYCPWAWITSRWMLEVEKVRPVETKFHLMSLAVLNEGRELPPQYVEFMEKAWAGVRVAIAAEQRYGAHVHRALYSALGTAIHLEQLQGEEALVRALSLAELDADLVSAASDASLDEAVRASHLAGMEPVGMDVGTPVLRIGETSIFGPVVTPAPKGEAAGVMFDGVKALCQTEGFYELKRSRTVGPSFG